jgi:hypothetical protein
MTNDQRNEFEAFSPLFLFLFTVISWSRTRKGCVPCPVLALYFTSLKSFLSSFSFLLGSIEFERRVVQGLWEKVVLALLSVLSRGDDGWVYDMTNSILIV